MKRRKEDHRSSFSPLGGWSPAAAAPLLSRVSPFRLQVTRSSGVSLRSSLTDTTTKTTMSDRYARAVTSPPRETGVCDPVVVNAGFTFRLNEPRPKVHNHVKVDPASSVPHTESSCLTKEIDKFLKKSDHSLDRFDNNNKKKLAKTEAPPLLLPSNPTNPSTLPPSIPEPHCRRPSPEDNSVTLSSATTATAAERAKRNRRLLAKIVDQGRAIPTRNGRGPPPPSLSSSSSSSSAFSSTEDLFRWNFGAKEDQDIESSSNNNNNKSDDTSAEISKLEDLSSGSDEEFFDVTPLPGVFCIPGKPHVRHSGAGTVENSSTGRTPLHSYSLPAVNKLHPSTKMGNTQQASSGRDAYPIKSHNKKYPAPPPPPSRENSFIDAHSSSRQSLDRSFLNSSIDSSSLNGESSPSGTLKKQLRRNPSFKKYPAPQPPLKSNVETEPRVTDSSRAGSVTTLSSSDKAAEDGSPKSGGKSNMKRPGSPAPHRTAILPLRKKGDHRAPDIPTNKVNTSTALVSDQSAKRETSSVFTTAPIVISKSDALVTKVNVISSSDNSVPSSIITNAPSKVPKKVVDSIKSPISSVQSDATTSVPVGPDKLIEVNNIESRRGDDDKKDSPGTEKVPPSKADLSVKSSASTQEPNTPHSNKRELHSSTQQVVSESNNASSANSLNNVGNVATSEALEEKSKLPEPNTFVNSEVKATTNDVSKQTENCVHDDTKPPDQTCKSEEKRSDSQAGDEEPLKKIKKKKKITQTKSSNSLKESSDERSSRGSSVTSSRGVTPDRGLRPVPRRSVSGKLAALTNKFEADEKLRTNEISVLGTKIAEIPKSPLDELIMGTKMNSKISDLNNVINKDKAFPVKKKDTAQDSKGNVIGKILNPYSKPFSASPTVVEKQRSSIGGIDISKFGGFGKPKRNKKDAENNSEAETENVNSKKTSDIAKTIDSHLLKGPIKEEVSKSEPDAKSTSKEDVAVENNKNKEQNKLHTSKDKNLCEAEENNQKDISSPNDVNENKNLNAVQSDFTEVENKVPKETEPKQEETTEKVTNKQETPKTENSSEIGKEVQNKMDLPKDEVLPHNPPDVQEEELMEDKENISAITAEGQRMDNAVKAPAKLNSVQIDEKKSLPECSEELRLNNVNTLDSKTVPAQINEGPVSEKVEETEQPDKEVHPSASKPEREVLSSKATPVTESKINDTISPPSPSLNKEPVEEPHEVVPTATLEHSVPNDSANVNLSSVPVVLSHQLSTNSSQDEKILVSSSKESRPVKVVAPKESLRDPCTEVQEKESGANISSNDNSNFKADLSNKDSITESSRGKMSLPDTIVCNDGSEMIEKCETTQEKLSEVKEKGVKFDDIQHHQLEDGSPPSKAVELDQVLVSEELESKISEGKSKLETSQKPNFLNENHTPKQTSVHLEISSAEGEEISPSPIPDASHSPDGLASDRNLLPLEPKSSNTSSMSIETYVSAHLDISEEQSTGQSSKEPGSRPASPIMNDPILLDSSSTKIDSAKVELEKEPCQSVVGDLPRSNNINIPSTVNSLSTTTQFDVPSSVPVNTVSTGFSEKPGGYKSQALSSSEPISAALASISQSQKLLNQPQSLFQKVSDLFQSFVLKEPKYQRKTDEFNNHPSRAEVFVSQGEKAVDIEGIQNSKLQSSGVLDQSVATTQPLLIQESSTPTISVEVYEFKENNRDELTNNELCLAHESQQSVRPKVRRHKDSSIPDEVLNVSEILRDVDERLSKVMTKPSSKGHETDEQYLDAYDTSNFDILMPLPEPDGATAAAEKRSRSSTPLVDRLERSPTPKRTVVMEQTEAMLSETDRLLRKTRSQHSLRRSFTRSLSGANMNRLTEVTADLSEEHNTAQLASERIEAEQAERMRLEKEVQQLQDDVHRMTTTNDKLEMEKLTLRNEMLQHVELNGDVDDEDDDASLYKRKYEWALREMEVLKKQLKQQQEDDLDQLLILKKQLEKKVADAYEETDEQRQVVGQMKKKSQRLQAEMNDMKILLEEQTSRNNLLEKKQRKFDQELQSVLEEQRNERLSKDKIQRERDQILSEKYSYEQEVSTLKLELDMKEEKISALTREINDLNFTGKVEEEVAVLKKAKHDLELRVKDQEEELDDLAGQVQMLESAKVRLEMSIEQMRKDNRKEVSQRDEEVEEVRLSAQKKIKALESQLESEHEERTSLVREKHDLERRLVAAHSRSFSSVDEDSFHRVKKELKKTKALLKDTQTMLEKTQSEGSNKLLLRQLKTQLEDAEFAKNAAMKARQSTESDFSELQNQMEEVLRAKKDTEDKLVRMTKEKSEMQTQLEESEEEASEVMKKYKATVSQLSVDQINISEQSQLIAELEHDKQVLQEKLTELTSKVEVLEGETANIHTQRRLQMKIKELESKLDLELTTRQRLESQITRLKDQVDRVSIECDAIRMKEVQAVEHGKKLTRQLREAKEDVNNLQQKLTDSTSRKQEVEKQYELAESEIITLKSDLKLAFKRIEDLQQALQGDLSDSDSEISESGSESESSLSPFLSASSRSDCTPSNTALRTAPTDKDQERSKHELLGSPMNELMSVIKEDAEEDYKESFA